MENRVLNLEGCLGERVTLEYNPISGGCYINIFRPITGTAVNTVLESAEATALANFFISCMEEGA